MSGYCGACNKPLFEETVHVGNRQLHPECFKCTSCQVAIKGAFFTEPHGYYCTECMQGSSNKWCAGCKFRVYKGKNYCAGCREKVQLADKGEREAHFSHVIHDQKAIEEQNRRVAANSGAQRGKFDYHERLQWEREEREKAGYPEPEKKW